ncbi:hypothetical protein IFM61606_08987 [Aspergillus udagawae]|nr:hypothetical protein IFM61606_08987 [Aspergillus udagawae]GFF43853.1 hypothetical protein IFM51744_05616 [Aspergillus udagawae]
MDTLPLEIILANMFNTTPALQLLGTLYIINKVLKEAHRIGSFYHSSIYRGWIKNVNLSAVKGTSEWARLDEQAACSALGTATREIIGAGVEYHCDARKGMGGFITSRTNLNNSNTSMMAWRSGGKHASEQGGQDDGPQANIGGSDPW